MNYGDTSKTPVLNNYTFRFFRSLLFEISAVKYKIGDYLLKNKEIDYEKIGSA